MLEIVINTFDSLGTPHLDALKKSNPGKNIYVNCGRDASEPAEKLDMWRNCDREIRNWWKKNRDKVAANHVVFLEGDVLVNYDLEDLISPNVDLIGNVIKEISDDPGWKWFNDRLFLPEETQDNLVGIIPLAALVLSRKCLDLISSPKWDETYREDVFCELRIATIARTEGCIIGNHQALQGCDWAPIKHPGNKPGVWHAVKK